MPSNRIAQSPLVCHGHTRPIVELTYRWLEAALLHTCVAYYLHSVIKLYVCLQPYSTLKPADSVCAPILQVAS